MTSVTSGSVTVTYTYDGAGQKVRRQGPSGAQRYYFDYFSDVPRILAEADAGSGTFQTIYQRDIFGNLLSDGTTWHQFDGLGSIVSRTNSSGALTGSTLYGAWGTIRSQSGAQGKWGFTGAEWDPDAKGYHIGARWYDPSLGRWWAEDPSHALRSGSTALNLYTYAGGRPTVLVDRNGRRPTYSGYGSCSDDVKEPPDPPDCRDVCPPVPFDPSLYEPERQKIPGPYDTSPGVDCFINCLKEIAPDCVIAAASLVVGLVGCAIGLAGTPTVVVGAIGFGVCIAGLGLGVASGYRCIRAGYKCFVGCMPPI